MAVLPFFAIGMRFTKLHKSSPSLLSLFGVAVERSLLAADTGEVGTRDNAVELRDRLQAMVAKRGAVMGVQVWAQTGSIRT